MKQANGMKLTISRKLLLGYLVMALLTGLAGAYAVVSLRHLNNLADGITSQDFIIVETSKKLMDTLLAQESARQKYLILKDPSLAEIYRARNQEFAQGVQELQGHSFPGLSKGLSRMLTLNGQYGAIFDQEAALVAEPPPGGAAQTGEDGKKMIDDLALQVRTIQQQAEKDIDLRMNLIRKQGEDAARMTIGVTVLSLSAALVVALLITYNISLPLGRLEKATRLIADGQFDHNLNIDRPDEIGSLAKAFGVMTRRLKDLEAMHLDASPLTGLPGNLAIERAIEERLVAKTIFSLCQIDLDNFKPFADKYGYAWGSEIIKKVANILLDERAQASLQDVFVGHIGGDDFVLIAEPGQTEKLGRRLVAVFDEQIRPFYTEEDQQQGFIIGRDRKGREQKFPLLSVSVAMVASDGRPYKNALEMAEVVAELKEFAKSLPGNNFVKEEDIAGHDPSMGRA